MRSGWGFTLAGGAMWPDQQGGREAAPFKYIRVHHRTPTAIQPIICCLDGPPPLNGALDDDRTWDVFYPGERRVRNTGGVADPWTDDLHFLNLDANPVAIYVETSDTPIVDIAGVQGVHLLDGTTSGPAPVLSGIGVGVGDISAFFTESTTPLAAAGTFTGAWRDCVDYNWAAAYAVSDQSFTLFVDEADAATPNVINQVASQASAAAPAGNNPGGQFARIVPTKTVLRFIRVRILNGATLQTRLNVQSSLSPLN